VNSEVFIVGLKLNVFSLFGRVENLGDYMGLWVEIEYLHYNPIIIQVDIITSILIKHFSQYFRFLLMNTDYGCVPNFREDRRGFKR